MHIVNGNTSPCAKKGNFSQRQAKRSALETDKRMAQILFTTWGIENAVQKTADLMRQDRRRLQNITKIAEEDLMKAKEKMTEWLKEKEKPAVNKRKQEEKKPKKAEPNFFEEGVELRENALNVELLRVASQRNQGGVYICKSEREAKELMQRFGGYESDIPLFVAIRGKVQTATLRAAAMAHGIEPREFSFPITKHSSNDDQHQHREGWVWKVAGKIELAMSTAPPKAAWQPDYHRNLQAPDGNSPHRHSEGQGEKSARKQERPLLSPKKPQKVFFWQELLQ